MSLKLVPPREGRSRYWRIRGTIKGQYIDESTGVSSQTRAEEIRIKRANRPKTRLRIYYREPGIGLEIPRHWQLGRQALDGRWRSSEQQALVHLPPIGLANSVNLRVSAADLC